MSKEGIPTPVENISEVVENNVVKKTRTTGEQVEASGGLAPEAQKLMDRYSFNEPRSEENVQKQKDNTPPEDWAMKHAKETGADISEREKLDKKYSSSAKPVVENNVVKKTRTTGEQVEASGGLAPEAQKLMDRYSFNEPRSVVENNVVKDTETNQAEELKPESSEKKESDEVVKTEGAESSVVEETESKKEVSVLDQIKEARDVIEKVNSKEDYGREGSWIKSSYNKLVIRLGWFKDILGFSKLSTIDKVLMSKDNLFNNRLVKKKKIEINKINQKIENNEKYKNNEALLKENIDRFNSLIKEAQNSGDKKLEATAKAGLDKLERLGSRRGQLEIEKSSLVKQLNRYNEIKIFILDNYIANVETKIEGIRLGNNYYENLERRTSLNFAIEKSLDIIAKADNQILNLKKALTSPQSKEERTTIKNSIKKYKKAIKDSKKKVSGYERSRKRVNSFIELTDKRTNKFEDFKNEYLDKKKESQKSIEDENKVKPAGSTKEGEDINKTEDNDGLEKYKNILKGEVTPKLRDLIAGSNVGSAVRSSILEKTKNTISTLEKSLNELNKINRPEKSIKDFIKNTSSELKNISEQIKKDKGIVSEDTNKKIKKFAEDALKELK